MVKFKIESFGITGAKDWLNESCKQLPYIFSLSDVQYSGCFSTSIIKRLGGAKKHGLKITLRKGRGYHIFIRVINKEYEKNQQKNIAIMKRLATKLSKSEDVVKYFDTVRKIKTIDCCYRGPHESYR